MIGRIECSVVTPESTVLEQPGYFVSLPLYDGEIGIGPNHAPLIGRLTFGEMRLRSGETTDRYYIDGGFVQVVENRVSVLTPRAIPAEEVDAKAAKKQLDKALKQKANTPERLAIRDRLVAQARAQLRVARSSG